MEIIYRNPSELTEYKNNARIHSEKQIEKISKSIKDFGFLKPVLITRDNIIITGHGVVKAAKVENINNIPCVIAEDLTEAQWRAFCLVDNKLSELSTWDTELVNHEVTELLDEGINMDDFGFAISLDEIVPIDLEDDTKNNNDAMERTVISCPKCGFKFGV